MIARGRFVKAGKVVGILCLLWPGYELAGTVVRVWRAFATLSASGIGDPSSLAGGLGETVRVDFFGVLLFVLGVGILLWIRFQERKFRSVEPHPPTPRAR